MNAQQIHAQVLQLTNELIATNLSISQNYPVISNYPGRVQEVSFSKTEAHALLLAGVAYDTVYAELEKKNLYNLKLIDGGLIQFLYRFVKGQLVAHRVGFFPAPHFHAYDEEPELYESDELYSDVIAEGLVRFPVRFDYDADSSRHRELDHPKVHLTLGQYPNCRIPVSCPITPRHFAHFILRNFYFVAMRSRASGIALNCQGMARDMSSGEMRAMHLVIPSTAA